MLDQPITGWFARSREDTTGESKVNDLMYVPDILDIVNPVVISGPEPEFGYRSQYTAVTDVHASVVQIGLPILTVGVVFLDMKLNPCTVILAPPEMGAFTGAKFVATAASNVKMFTIVPISLATVTARRRVLYVASSLAQVSDVEDIHELEAQRFIFAMTTDTDGSDVP